MILSRRFFCFWVFSWSCGFWPKIIICKRPFIFPPGGRGRARCSINSSRPTLQKADSSSAKRGTAVATAGVSCGDALSENACVRADIHVNGYYITRTHTRQRKRAMGRSMMRYDDVTRAPRARFFSLVTSSIVTCQNGHQDTPSSSSLAAAFS